MAKQKPTVTKSITDAVNQAFELMAEIKDEIQETYDELSDRGREGERGEFLQELISSIDAHSEPDVADFIGSEDVVLEDSIRKPVSKKSRRDHAVYLLDNVHAVVEMLDADTDRDWSEDEAETLSSFRDEIDTIKSDWESIEFSR